MSEGHFCTCGDLSCPFNPKSHAKGCDDCVKKNLKAGEIPSCFFHLVKDDLSGLNEFTIDRFVDFVLENRKHP